MDDKGSNEAGVKTPWENSTHHDTGSKVGWAATNSDTKQGWGSRSRENGMDEELPQRVNPWRMKNSNDGTNQNQSYDKDKQNG